MTTRPLTIESVAVVCSVGAAGATAAGVTALARGSTRGAPGVTKSLSRLGRAVGGGMLMGVAVAAGTGALVGLGVYRGLTSMRAPRPRA